MTLSRIRPNGAVVEPKFALGAANEGVLVKFCASTRISKLYLSVNLNFLESEASV